MRDFRPKLSMWRFVLALASMVILSMVIDLWMQSHITGGIRIGFPIAFYERSAGLPPQWPGGSTLGEPQFNPLGVLVDLSICIGLAWLVARRR
jgi:hypothetical protein